MNLSLGEIYEQEHNYEDAIKHLKIAYIYSNEKMSLVLKIAKCYERLNMKEETMISYENAI